MRLLVMFAADVAAGDAEHRCVCLSVDVCESANVGPWDICPVYKH